MLATPSIQIAFTSEFDAPVDTTLTLPDGGDGTIWYHAFNVPEITQQGFVTIGITATDLATNPLQPDDVTIPNNLYIDNVVPEATFTYENVSNPSLTNIGIGGDTIRVTVTMNEPLLTSEPIPSINYTYGYGDGEMEPLLLVRCQSQLQMVIRFGYFRSFYQTLSRMMGISILN